MKFLVKASVMYHWEMVELDFYVTSLLYGLVLMFVIHSIPASSANLNPIGEKLYQERISLVNEVVSAQYDDDIDAQVDVDALGDGEGFYQADLDSDASNDSSQIDAGSAQGLDDFKKSGKETQAEAWITSPEDEKTHLLSPSTTTSITDIPLNAISPSTLQKFVEVIDVVRQDYIKPVNDEALFQYAIAGMLERLDGHAEYLSPNAYERLRNFTEGEIGEVGLTIRYDENFKLWRVADVIPDTSAYDLGIRQGDQLLSIKKVVLNKEMAQEDVEQLLVGIAGSQVSVVTKNRYGHISNILVQRDLTHKNRLSVHLERGVAIVRLPVFQNNTKTQLLKILKQIDIPLRGIVIDVRNNPGGVLSSAIDIASLFVAEGALIEVTNRVNEKQFIAPNGTPYLESLPVVVLQNRYSASAAEVLASALQHHGAIVMGETSFGKGTVQEVIPLQTGGGVKLTVAEYHSVDGERINGLGVAPDIVLEKFLTPLDWHQSAVNYLLELPPVENQLNQTGVVVSIPDVEVQSLGDY